MDSYLKSWWDLWAASYVAPGWDAKEKKSAARGKVGAVRATDEAIRQLELCLKFDKD